MYFVQKGVKKGHGSKRSKQMISLKKEGTFLVCLLSPVLLFQVLVVVMLFSQMPSGASVTTSTLPPLIILLNHHLCPGRSALLYPTPPLSRHASGTTDLTYLSYQELLTPPLHRFSGLLSSVRLDPSVPEVCQEEGWKTGGRAGPC